MDELKDELKNNVIANGKPEVKENLRASEVQKRDLQFKAQKRRQRIYRILLLLLLLSPFAIATMSLPTSATPLPLLSANAKSVSAKNCPPTSIRWYSVRRGRCIQSLCVSFLLNFREPLSRWPKGKSVIYKLFLKNMVILIIYFY